MATNIDTLTTYEAIAAAGVEDQAARAISKAIDKSHNASRADFATKADIDNLRLKMESEFGAIRLEAKAATSDLGKTIAEAKADTLKTFWLAVALLLAVGTGLNTFATYLVTHAVTVTSK